MGGRGNNSEGKRKGGGKTEREEKREKEDKKVEQKLRREEKEKKISKGSKRRTDFSFLINKENQQERSNAGQMPHQ